LTTQLILAGLQFLELLHQPFNGFVGVIRRRLLKLRSSRLRLDELHVLKVTEVWEWLEVLSSLLFRDIETELANQVLRVGVDFKMASVHRLMRFVLLVQTRVLTRNCLLSGDCRILRLRD
jgi:hypothetical protein